MCVGLTPPALIDDGGFGTGVQAVKAADATAHVDGGRLRINTARLAHIFTPHAFGAGLLIQCEMENRYVR